MTCRNLPRVRACKDALPGKPVTAYHMLKYDLPFRDLGEGYYNRFNSEKKINYYLKKLQNLGWQPPTSAMA